MMKFKKGIYMLCIFLALSYTAVILLGKIIRPAPDRFTSVYPMESLPPMMCFADDSVVNVGSAEELDKLPNIGKVLSQRIIDYRELWGDYRIPEDLVMVNGIGEKTVNGIMEVLEEMLVPRYPGE